MKHYIYGVDIGGTNIKLGLFLKETLQLIESTEIKTPTERQEVSIFEHIEQEITRINHKHHLSYEDIKGIGLAVPCPVKNGFVQKCPNLNWKTMDIAKNMSLFLPPHVTVKVSNDATLAALGENNSLEHPFQNAILYTLGTGVGGGVIVDGKILEGGTGLGGEIGHMPIPHETDEICGCGSKGCLEQVCGTKAIFKRTKALAKTQQTSINLHDLSVKSIFDAAKENDAVGLIVVHEVSKAIAYSASILSIVLDPEVFIIGGGISKAGQFLVDLIEQYYQPYARFHTGSVPFILAKTGNQAGIIGAAHYLKK
jgi:glucokinase